MQVAERLRELREARNLSQGDIEKRTGLLRCYISRVENGHTMPSVDTLEKLAKALEVEFHQLFPTGGDPSAPADAPAQARLSREERRLLNSFRNVSADEKPMVLGLIDLFGRISSSDKETLMVLARHASRKARASIVSEAA